MKQRTQRCNADFDQRCTRRSYIDAGAPNTTDLLLTADVNLTHQCLPLHSGRVATPCCLWCLELLALLAQASIAGHVTAGSVTSFPLQTKPHQQRLRAILLTLTLSFLSLI